MRLSLAVMLKLKIQKMARKKYKVDTFIGEKNWVDAHKKYPFE